MEETSRHSDQEQDLIYALDIGTRSVIGLLARQEQDKMRVLEVERRPHERRTMLDGQIEDIRQVAKVVSEVTKSLEERSGRKLERACVAAAGRALRTERGEYCLELSAPEIVSGSANWSWRRWQRRNAPFRIRSRSRGCFWWGTLLHSFGLTITP